MRYDYANMGAKRQWCLVSLICLAMIVLISWLAIVKGTIHAYSTKIWRVTIDRKNDERLLVPVNGNWTNTLIWFHDFNEDTKLA